MLFDWIRHYAALIVLVVTVGAVGAFAYLQVFPPRSEAWSLVVETGTGIPARQLGPVADAVFHSAAVYQPVMQQLGVVGSPESFLSGSTDLRPVPGTNTLIVVGRSNSLARAVQISNAMAASLVQVFHVRAGLGGFTVFSEAEPAPIREAIPLRQAILLGGGFGLWIGLGLAALHYRVRRPMLSPEVALRMTGPEPLAVLERNRPTWLGVLTSSPVWKDTGRNRAVLSEVVDGSGRPLVVAPGARARTRKAVERRLSRTVQRGGESLPPDPEAADLSLLVCHPSTPASDFGLAAADQSDRMPPRRVQIVWVS